MNRAAAIFCLALIALAPHALAEQASVTIQDTALNPATIRVAVGGSVKWENRDGADVQLVADDGSFDSGTLRQGASFEVKFAKKGRVPYRCRLHPRMKGVVIVE